MKTQLLSVLLAGALGAGVATLLRPGAPPAAAADTGDERRIAALEERLDRLDQALAARPQAPPVDTRIAPADLDARIQGLLDAALRARAAEIDAMDGAAVAAVTAAPAGDAPIDVAATVAKIMDPMIGWDESELLWDSLRKAGLLDEAIALIEEKVEADPSNPDLHTLLGSALLQKLVGADNHLEQGTLAVAADKAFDKALELDNQHWDARFKKACSLAFWPPIFGKGAEAVRHFEVLIGQQESRGDHQPHYAESYLFLGNLYQQQGNPTKAEQVWKQGLSLFPNHTGLKQQSGS